jgi:hypothetical protein
MRIWSRAANLDLMDTHAREWEAWNYRRQGLTYREIGNLMGIHPCAAREYVTKVAKIIAVDGVLQVEQAQQIELDRLDALLVVATKIFGCRGQHHFHERDRDDHIDDLNHFPDYH